MLSSSWIRDQSWILARNNLDLADVAKMIFLIIRAKPDLSGGSLFVLYGTTPVLPPCYIWPISGDHRAKVAVSPSLILPTSLSTSQGRVGSQPACFIAFFLVDLLMGVANQGWRRLWFPWLHSENSTDNLSSRGVLGSQYPWIVLPSCHLTSQHKEESVNVSWKEGRSGCELWGCEGVIIHAGPGACWSPPTTPEP